MKKILLSFAAALLLVTSVFAGETGKKREVGSGTYQFKTRIK